MPEISLESFSGLVWRQLLSVVFPGFIFIAELYWYVHQANTLNELQTSLNGLGPVGTTLVLIVTFAAAYAAGVIVKFCGFRLLLVGRLIWTRDFTGFGRYLKRIAGRGEPHQLNLQALVETSCKALGSKFVLGAFDVAGWDPSLTEAASRDRAVYAFAQRWLAIRVPKGVIESNDIEIHIRAALAVPVALFSLALSLSAFKNSLILGVAASLACLLIVSGLLVKAARLQSQKRLETVNTFAIYCNLQRESTWKVE